VKQLVPLPVKRFIDQLLGLAPFRARVVAAEARLNALDRQFPELRAELDTLQGPDAQHQALDDARQRLTALEAEIAALKTTARPSEDLHFHNALSHRNFQMVRVAVSENYIRGNGIEIGALNLPLPVAGDVQVRYVDRETEAELHDQYDELGMAEVDFIDPDVVDDAEQLRQFPDNSEDFVIASHVLEHLENPVRAFKNWLRVVRHGGVVYVALPDMRRCFDAGREVTSVEHVIRDYEEGPAWSRSMAFRDFGKIYVAFGMDKGLVEHLHGEARSTREQAEAERLDRKNFSIHFHAWTPDAMMEMFLATKARYGLSFETELMLQNQDEVIFVFRKTVPRPGGG